MPVRSLHTSVLKWPDAGTVGAAVRQWAREMRRDRPEVIRLGYFGSYARGDWGVGSDLDLVIVVSSAEEPFERRGARWPTTDLPVPTDVLVYTDEEWQRLAPGRFGQTVIREAVWL